MKSKVVLVIVGVLFYLGSYSNLASALETAKIGVVNTKEIFESHPGAQKAKETLTKEFQQRQEEIKKQEKQIDKLKKQFEENQLLSDIEKEKRRIQIQEKIEDLLSYKDKAEQELSQKEEELTQPILKDIYQTISEIAKEKGLIMVLEEKADFIVYWLDEMEITDVVVKRLKNKLIIPSPKVQDEKTDNEKRNQK